MIRRAMSRPDGSLATALASLEGRWGTAAIRLGNGGSVGSSPPTQGALALVPEQVPELPSSVPLGDDAVRTGFPALDAILAPVGLPREAGTAIRGDLSSGKTTLALRCIAEAQQRGAIAAWLDLACAFDPVEAVARGVDLRWLIVVRPADVPEGFALGAALLSGRTVDLLAVDLPSRLPVRADDALRRLTAHARRVSARLLVLEPRSLAGSFQGTLAESTGLRLELERRSWIRLGDDVVGQHTEVTVAKNRYGPPGRRADLEIHYQVDGERAVAAHGFAHTGQGPAIEARRAPARAAV
jgi:recombination protein RecA